MNKGKFERNWRKNKVVLKDEYLKTRFIYIRVYTNILTLYEE